MQSRQAREVDPSYALDDLFENGYDGAFVTLVQNESIIQTDRPEVSDHFELDIWSILQYVLDCTVVVKHDSCVQ